MGDGQNKIDTTFIDNAVQAHLDAFDALHGKPDARCAGKAYFVSNGEPKAVAEIVNALLRAAGAPAVDKLLPFRAAYALGALLEGVWTVLPLRGEPQMTRFLAEQLSTTHFYDISAARRDFGWILLACLVGFIASRSSANLLGPELGMFMGAFAVGVLASLVARRADQPSALIEVPGTLVLVPGSIGFRSITAMLENQVVSGLETAFRVLLIAMSLVAGLLMANLVMPRPRRL